MGKKVMVFVVAVMMLAVGGGIAAGEAQTVAGKVDAVTLYRGQALVTRVIPVTLSAGSTEIVVADLPQHAVPDSLFASGGEGVEIRAVRFRQRAVREEPREEIRSRENEIYKLEKDLRRNQRMQQVAAHRAEYLGKLEQFTAPTANVELSKGVLNADTLAELTVFLFEQNETQSMTLLDLQEEERELGEEIALLKRKLSELAAGSSRTVREAVLVVRGDEEGDAALRLNYLVEEAGWEPFYNVRGPVEDGMVRVEYNATAQQMSGEDWSEVELTLSTASPALRSEGPELGPFAVALSQQPQALTLREQEDDAMAAQRQLVVNEKALQRARVQAKFFEANYDQNLFAAALQNIELTAGGDFILRLPAPGVVEGLSVTYRLPGRISLPSRNDKQTVEIASMAMDSEFYFVASPILSGYVYREVELTNDSDLALLEGPATVYLDGGFVGRTEVPMVAVGQRFTVGFGMDSQLRARREMADRAEQTLGANKQITFDYRLLLENYKDTPVRVRLFDRIPNPSEGADVRVTLGEMTEELSIDPLYLQREKPKGILRWDIEVPAKSAGPDALTVAYQYSVEFDRKLHIVPQTEGQAEQEFQKLMKARRQAQ